MTGESEEVLLDLRAKDYKPTEWDYSMYEKRDALFHPLIDRVWNPDYLNEVSLFVRRNDTGGNNQSVTDAHTRLMMSGDDFREGNPVPVWESMHQEEARVRGIQIPLFQRMLHMQERLHVIGYRPDSYVDQRTDLANSAGLVYGEDILANGTKVAGLGLCFEKFYILKSAGLSDKASQLLEKITDKFGLDCFNSQVVGHSAKQVGNHVLREDAWSWEKEVSKNAEMEVIGFMKLNLSRSEQSKVTNEYVRLARVKAKEALEEKKQIFVDLLTTLKTFLLRKKKGE